MVIVALLLLGLCAGSFINALVWRVHEQSRSKKKSKDLSVMRGRSMCPDCRHSLGMLDLIPVVSWLMLRGRCRYCHKSISFQYPAVELVTALLFMFSYWQWPYALSGSGLIALGVWLVCMVLLIALAVYDFRWMLLPDRIVFPLTGFSVALALIVARMDGLSHIIGAILGAVFLSGIFWGLFQLSSGRWIGGGDVKVALALGLIAGSFWGSVLLLFIASLLGTLVSLPLLLRTKHISHKVPFGPFLICAGFIVFFLWPAVS